MCCPSTPIILSNGKSFERSLKSSHSSPHVPGVRLHQHAQTEPAMPAGGPVKNVHFASDESLRTVRVFNASGKPINGSKQQAADDNPSSPDILKRLVSAARPKALRCRSPSWSGPVAGSSYPLNVTLFFLTNDTYRYFFPAYATSSSARSNLQAAGQDMGSSDLRIILTISSCLTLRHRLFQ